MTSPVLGCRQKSEGRKEEKKRLAAPAGLQPKWDRCAKVWDRGGDNKPANQRGIYWRDFLHCWTSDKRCHEIPSPLRMYINFKDICAKKKKNFSYNLLTPVDTQPSRFDEINRKFPSRGGGEMKLKCTQPFTSYHKLSSRGERKDIFFTPSKTGSTRVATETKIDASIKRATLPKRWRKLINRKREKKTCFFFSAKEAIRFVDVPEAFGNKKKIKSHRRNRRNKLIWDPVAPMDLELNRAAITTA